MNGLNENIKKNGRNKRHEMRSSVIRKEFQVTNIIPKVFQDQGADTGQGGQNGRLPMGKTGKERNT